MERIAWRATIHGVKKSWIKLGNFHFISQVVPAVKNPAASGRDTRDASLIPGLGRCSGGGIGNPLQNSCLGNPMDRGTWRAIVHGTAKESGTTIATKQLKYTKHTKKNYTLNGRTYEM